VTSRVLLVGDAMFDVVVQATAAVAPTSDTPANVRVSRGGAAANVAVALASFGHEVLYVGVVGDDVFGTMFCDDLTHNGVMAQMEVARGATGVVVALVAADGQRSMMTDRGVNGLLTLDSVRLALDASFDHLHVSGYTLLDERTRATGASALSLARERGLSTSVDVCSVGPLVQVTAATFLAAAESASMLFANEEEALVLTDSCGVDEAASLLARRFDEVLITRGRDGALAAVGGRHWHAESQSLEVLDTTGAGDAAGGAYLAARLEGDDVAAALIRAMACAATVVRALGARGSSRS
jgi:sugar/nucleoside kinase (ribokinase family)